MIEAAGQERPTGDTLMLGRQEVFVAPRLRDRLADEIAAAPHGTRPDQSAFEGYAEDLLAAIGFEGMKSMDATAYEGCDYVHDLNQATPGKLDRTFSLIFDGGTIEHVFNASQAFLNVHNMLKPGGLFLGMSPGDGWFGHGFWQFSPEIVYSYFGKSLGYEVLTCLEYPSLPRKRPWSIADPHKTGKRAKRRSNSPAVYLAFLLRKPLQARKPSPVQQSDYEARWSDAEGSVA
ncbi:class I SAM-dependent methyltransferase [Ruegeria arenilitoris]|uniref:class I SAM-dependent methyltransferase n=1 Tax=Ruegeria arenilitoris TaxID=1173585 RepID=UPI001481407B|nr:class I SAM-dependent methyltransferase [Ruegeria arenilitoris]